MSQQQWGGNLNWGQSTSYNPVAPYQQGQPYAAGPGPGYPSGPAVPVAPFGTGSPMPQPKRRNPMRLALRRADHDQVRRPGVNAFYCSGDQQIYYSNQLPEAFRG